MRLTAVTDPLSFFSRQCGCPRLSLLPLSPPRPLPPRESRWPSSSLWRDELIILESQTHSFLFCLPCSPLTVKPGAPIKPGSPLSPGSPCGKKSEGERGRGDEEKGGEERGTGGREGRGEGRRGDMRREEGERGERRCEERGRGRKVKKT